MGRGERIKACQERAAIEKRLRASQDKWKAKRSEEKDFFAQREEGKRKIEEIEESAQPREEEKSRLIKTQEMEWMEHPLKLPFTKPASSQVD